MRKLTPTGAAAQSASKLAARKWSLNLKQRIQIKKYFKLARGVKTVQKKKSLKKGLRV